MDQAILRAIVAPTKLAWKSQLGKDLMSTYGIDEQNAISFPGTVTAVVTLSGDLEGRVLFILTERTAKSVEAAFTSRWDEGLNQRTLNSVSELMRPIVDNIPKLLKTGGHECTVDLAGVLNTKGKGIAKGKEVSQIIMLASTPDFDNPASKDEISVWVMLETAGADQDSESPDDEIPKGKTTGSGCEDEDDAENADALATTGTDIQSAEGFTRDESNILNELQAEFEHAPEPPPFSYQDMANMMAAEEALEGGEFDTTDKADEADKNEGDPPPELEESPGSTLEVYPSIHAGVVTTEKLEIVDSDGKVRSVLTTLRDGSPYLLIADATGRIRATLRLNVEGDARLTFVDEMGAETWKAPRDEPPPAEETEPARERAPATPVERKSESAGPGSNGGNLRPKAAPTPTHRKSGAPKASPRGKPSKKSSAVASTRRNPPKTAGKRPQRPQRRRTAKPAGVR